MTALTVHILASPCLPPWDWASIWEEGQGLLIWHLPCVWPMMGTTQLFAEEVKGKEGCRVTKARREVSFFLLSYSCGCSESPSSGFSRQQQQQRGTPSALPPLVCKSFCFFPLKKMQGQSRSLLSLAALRFLAPGDHGGLPNSRKKQNWAGAGGFSCWIPGRVRLVWVVMEGISEMFLDVWGQVWRSQSFQSIFTDLRMTAADRKGWSSWREGLGRRTGPGNLGPGEVGDLEMECAKHCYLPEPLPRRLGEVEKGRNMVALMAPLASVFLYLVSNTKSGKDQTSAEGEGDAGLGSV